MQESIAFFYVHLEFEIKNTKTSQVRCCIPGVPAVWEADVGGSSVPRSIRSSWLTQQALVSKNKRTPTATFT